MHPIENILNITMQELKQMVDVNTIVGTPFVTPEGETIIPISKVGFGFVTGGGEYKGQIPKKCDVADESKYPFAAGSGSGISITPMAFLVSGNGSLRILPIAERELVDKLLEQIPGALKEIGEFIRGRGKNDDQQEKSD